MLRYIAALLVVPLVDALFLVVVATQIGAPLTVLLVVLTALLGMLLVRAESRHTIRRIQEKLAAGELPTDELLDGGLLLVAGALTITPGLLTDLLGILLVVPVTRIPVRTAVRDYIVVPFVEKKSGGFATGNVYVGGFPSDDDGDFRARPGAGPGSGSGSGSGSASESGSVPGAGVGTGGETEDAYDLDPDAYDVEFEDDDESSA